MELLRLALIEVTLCRCAQSILLIYVIDSFLVKGSQGVKYRALRFRIVKWAGALVKVSVFKSVLVPGSSERWRG